MATTAQDLYDRIRRRYGSPNDTTRLSDAYLLELSVEGLREIARWTGYKGETSGLVSSTLNGFRYALPATIVRMKALYWNGNFVSPTTPEMLDRQVVNWRNADAASNPLAWYPDGLDYYSIYPKADAVYSNYMKCWGVAAPTEPASGTSPLDLPDRHVRVLMAYELWQLYESDSDRDSAGRSAATWEGNYRRWLADMGEDSQGDITEAHRVVDQSYDFGDPV